MLPLILSIEGVYSYQGKQTIDFEQLTNAGLFGIFGKVGAGKSTILESIGFVLYGDTERMNSNDKISYNMLNLKSNKAAIMFEFLNFEQKKYRFEVAWKREKKFDKISSFERAAYIWENNVWVPLRSTDATKIVGLSYENFKRTIIIPQGKFKEFLDLKGKDRSEMMMEIFHLQRFDLAPKVGSLKKAAENIQSEFKGKLEAFEDVSAEIIALQKEALAKDHEGLTSKKEEATQLTHTFNELETLKNDLQALKDKKEVLAQLNEQKETILQSEQQVNRFTRVERIFKSLFQDTTTKKQELLQKQQQKETIELEIKTVESELAEINARLVALEETNDQLILNKKKVLDYDCIIQLKLSEKAISEIQGKVTEYENSKVTLTETETAAKSKLTQAQENLEALKKKRIDPSLLVELGTWYTEYKRKNEKIKEQHEKIAQVTEEILQHQKVFTDLHVDISSWRSVFDTEKIKLESEKEALTLQKTNALLRKELAHYSSQLHDGENCPLCGSLEHPAILEVEDVGEILGAIEEQLEAKNRAVREVIQHISNLHTREQQLEESMKKLDAEKLLLSQTSEELIQLKSNFKWTDFSMENTELFEQKKSVLKEIEDAITNSENEVNKTRDQLNNIADKLKLISDESKQIAVDKARLDEERKGVISKLEVLKWSDFSTVDTAQILNLKQTLEEENNRIDSEVSSLTQSKIVKDQLLGERKAVSTLLQEQWSNLTVALENNTTQIKQLLQEHDFSSVEEVNEILNQTLDVEAITEKIKQFHIAVESTQKVIHDIEAKVQGRELVMEDYTAIVHKLTVLNEEIEQLKAQTSKKEGEVQRLESEYLKKVDLLKEFDKINQRVANLNILTNMFKANGFVNYVSGIYLRNLADNANARFHRITKNQLSLIINSKNEFEVVDYLNNGATRSVKTLSGGQSFQASLCLALALAESIQTQNASDKNFFFIDEGFGTQDAESVELVYQTLQSLLKENRIVGFISHLAELQERIPQSITILKNDQTGSYVTQN